MPLSDHRIEKHENQAHLLSALCRLLCKMLCKNEIQFLLFKGLGTIPKMKTGRFGNQPERSVFPVWVLTGFACYSARKSRLSHAVFRKCSYTCCACQVCAKFGTKVASNASVYTLAQKLVRESPETPNGFCKTGCAPAELYVPVLCP